MIVLLTKCQTTKSKEEAEDERVYIFMHFYLLTKGCVMQCISGLGGAFVADATCTSTVKHTLCMF